MQKIENPELKQEIHFNRACLELGFMETRKENNNSLHIDYVNPKELLNSLLNVIYNPLVNHSLYFQFRPKQMKDRQLLHQKVFCRFEQPMP